MALAAACFMAVFTLLLGSPSGVVAPAVYLAPTLVLLVSLYLVTRPRPLESIISVCCGAVVGLCFLSAWWATVEGRTTELQVLLVGLSMACTALLPWNGWHQICVATSAMVAIILNLYVVGGTIQLWGATSILPAATILLAASVYGNIELEKKRWEASAAELSLAKARKELLQINNDLEQRVEVHVAPRTSLNPDRLEPDRW